MARSFPFVFKGARQNPRRDDQLGGVVLADIAHFVPKIFPRS